VVPGVCDDDGRLRFRSRNWASKSWNGRRGVWIGGTDSGRGDVVVFLETHEHGLRDGVERLITEVRWVCRRCEKSAVGLLRSELKSNTVTSEKRTAKLETVGAHHPSPLPQTAHGARYVHSATPPPWDWLPQITTMPRPRPIAVPHRTDILRCDLAIIQVSRNSSIPIPIDLSDELCALVHIDFTNILRCRPKPALLVCISTVKRNVRCKECVRFLVRNVKQFCRDRYGSNSKIWPRPEMNLICRGIFVVEGIRTMRRGGEEWMLLVGIRSRQRQVKMGRRRICRGVL